MDYEALVRAIIKPIVAEPESVLIRVTEEGEKDLSIYIASEKEDTARLIGRHGTIANSIREVCSVAGKSESKHVHIKFESFGEDKED